jgi:hypothetical protein
MEMTRMLIRAVIIIKSKPPLFPAVLWMRVVCFFHYTCLLFKAQQKIWTASVFGECSKEAFLTNGKTGKFDGIFAGFL